MFDKKKIGPKIRQLRNDVNIKQDELASKIGISKQMLSNIETGYRDVTLDVLVTIADYFCVSLDYLTGRINDPHHNKFLGKAEQSLLHENYEFLDSMPNNYKDPDLREQIYSIEKRLKILFILRDMVKDYRESVEQFQKAQKKFDYTLSNEIVKYSKYYLQKLGFIGPTIYSVNDKEQRKALKRLQELDELLIDDKD